MHALFGPSKKFSMGNGKTADSGEDTVVVRVCIGVPGARIVLAFGCKRLKAGAEKQSEASSESARIVPAPALSHNAVSTLPDEWVSLLHCQHPYQCQLHDAAVCPSRQRHVESRGTRAGVYWQVTARITQSSIMGETTSVVGTSVCGGFEVGTVERPIELDSTSTERSPELPSVGLTNSPDARELDRELVVVRLKAWESAEELHRDMGEMCGDFLEMVITHLMSVQDTSTSAVLSAAMDRWFCCSGRLHL